MTLTQLLTLHNFPKPHNQCTCKHAIIGTGAVFYQSMGVLECTVCRGFQIIKRPMK